MEERKPETRVWILDYYRLNLDTGEIEHVIQEIELPADYHEHPDSGIYRVGEETVWFNRLHYPDDMRHLLRWPLRPLALATPDSPFRAYPRDPDVEFDRRRFTYFE